MEGEKQADHLRDRQASESPGTPPPDDGAPDHQGTQPGSPLSKTIEQTMSQTVKWVGYLSTLIGLGGSLAAGIHWYQQRQQHHAEFASRMAASQALENDGEYKASVDSYNSILKDDSLNHDALEAQLKAAMGWVENFQSIAQDNQKAAGPAGPELDSILAILNAGLARSKGTRAADIQAHIGWAHWLKQKIAFQEIGPAAQNNFQAALKADPANVYAHAMFGNYLLMTGGDLNDGIHHFQAAIATGKERPLVRRMQLGALLGRDQSTGAKAEIMRVANTMRKSGEPITDRARSSILNVCFDPPYTAPDDLRECLTTLSHDDSWQTFLWLDNVQKEGSYREAQLFTRSYIEAYLDEVTGDKPQALAKFKALQQAIKGKSSSFESPVNEAVKRLS